jgi:hypothetical protein
MRLLIVELEGRLHDARAGTRILEPHVHLMNDASRNEIFAGYDATGRMPKRHVLVALSWHREGRTGVDRATRPGLRR